MRAAVVPRSATSWVVKRSRYRNTPREIPSARTATTATDRSSTGGICHARVINHADSAARASALPSVATPANTASTTLRGDSSSSASARRRSDMLELPLRGRVAADLDDAVGGMQHRTP
ncbi:MAG: hypothetical protein NTX68_16480, partial [Rhodococcus sp.]